LLTQSTDQNFRLHQQDRIMTLLRQYEIDSGTGPGTGETPMIDRCAAPLYF
jgi:hypothetical protein